MYCERISSKDKQSIFLDKIFAVFTIVSEKMFLINKWTLKITRPQWRKSSEYSLSLVSNLPFIIVNLSFTKTRIILISMKTMLHYRRKCTIREICFIWALMFYTQLSFCVVLKTQTKVFIAPSSKYSRHKRSTEFYAKDITGVIA